MLQCYARWKLKVTSNVRMLAKAKKLFTKGKPFKKKEKEKDNRTKRTKESICF